MMHDLKIMGLRHGVEPEGEAGTFVAMEVCYPSGSTTSSVICHSSIEGNTIRLSALDASEEKV